MKTSSNINPEGVLEKGLACPYAEKAFVEKLWLKIEETEKQKTVSAFSLYLRWALLTLLVLASIGIMSIGPRQVWAQIRGWFIPGFGPLENPAEVLVLREKICQNRGEIKVTLENLVLGPESCWARFKLEGLSIDQRKVSESFSYHPEITLKLGDGPSFSTLRSELYISEAVFVEALFAVSEKPSSGRVSLVVTVPASENTALFTFMPALRPLNEKDVLPEADLRPLQSNPTNGVAVELLQVTYTAESTFYTVRIQTPLLKMPLGPWWENASLRDQNDKIYPLEMVGSWGSSGRSMVLRTRPLPKNAVMSLSISKMMLISDYYQVPGAPKFTLRPEDLPVPGSSKAFKQVLETEDTQIRINGLNLDEHGRNLSFSAEADNPAVFSWMLSCDAELCMGSKGGDFGAEAKKTDPALELRKVPESPFEVSLYSLYYQVEGPWRVSWQTEDVPLNAGKLPVPMNTPAPLATRSVPTIPAVTPGKEGSPKIMIAHEVDAVLEKGYQAFFSKPGWIHIKGEFIRTERTDLYQDGVEEHPRHLYSEAWYFIDENAKIGKSVTTLTDANGKLFSQTASLGTETTNFVTGKAWSITEEPYPKSNLASFLAYLGDQYVVEKKEVEADGKPLWLISYSSSHLAMQMPGFTLPVIGSTGRIWLDPESGWVLRQEMEYRFENKATLILYTNIEQVPEVIPAPPQEVLDLIERLK
ncbi:MAG: hypothetical protein VB108_02555 [Anaerolineaceae bacterium]|nr:hypothetical protein [Anaerolineaceae bacterium]